MIADMFWTRVRELIKLNNTTQEGLANSVLVSYRTLQNWMNRHILPDVNVGFKIARELHVSVEYLLTGDEKNNFEQELTTLRKKIKDFAANL